MRWRVRGFVLVARVAVGLGAVAAVPVGAYETDQYSNRLQPLADAAPELDAEVNRALTEIVARWRGPLDPRLFAHAIYAELGGLYWVDPLERFALRSPKIAKLPQRRRWSIFTGMPIWATRVNFVFGVGRTIRLAGTFVGTDKLGHFISQGYKYYRRHLRGLPEAKILARGRFAERWLFGQWTTGIFSNADLVANYQGYRFFRSLFEDGIVPGKGRLVGWRAGRPVLLREFTFADYVDDYWDEALNPSFFDPALQRAMDRRLPGLCPDYARDPAAFVSAHDAELAARYAGLGLRPTLRNRLDRVCAGDRPSDGPVVARIPH
jgi:hypothetical protein